MTRKMITLIAALAAAAATSGCFYAGPGYRPQYGYHAFYAPAPRAYYPAPYYARPYYGPPRW